MAKAYVQLPEEYLQKLSKLGNKTDEICEKIYDFLCDNRNTNADFFNSLC